MLRYRVYTGPTLVQTLAESLRSQAFDVTCEGTENVYVNAENGESLERALKFCGVGYHAQLMGESR